MSAKKNFTGFKIFVKQKKEVFRRMKKMFICSLIVIAGTCSLLNVEPANKLNDFGFQKVAAVTLGYDKSMSEKTIKAAVIDSYFRNVCNNGKLIRWNKKTMPLTVYVEDSSTVPEYYREVVMSAYQAWQRASEGLVRFEFVENSSDADMKCYFRTNDNADSIGVHTFSINGNNIVDSVIVFNRTNNKGHSHDSKQLFSSALQEV